MKRALCIVAVVAACRREAAPERGSQAVTPPAPAPAPAVVADAPAPAAETDLLHAVTARVAVSSVVANPQFSPYDLVDSDPDTAWNSRTGDDHAWIAFRVPADVVVTKVRITAGFTSKGPEGDYFTMNPRIRHVKISRAGELVRDADLDVDNRELQDIPLGTPGGDYKLELVATAPGTRKDWREIVVSELEVIGPAPAKRTNDLTVTVGSLDGKPVAPPNDVTMSGLSAVDSVAGDPPKVEMPVPAQLPKGWSKLSWIARQGSCRLVIEMNGKKFETDDLGDGCVTEQGWIDRRYSVTTHDRWLAITKTDVRAATDTLPAYISEQLVVCGTASDGEPACSSPFEIASISHREYGGGSPGADGLAITDDVEWQVDYKFDRGALVLSKGKGKVPDDYRDGLGRHRLPR